MDGEVEVGETVELAGIKLTKIAERIELLTMRSTRFFLEHIHEQTQYLVATSTGRSKNDFLRDRTLTLAFERSLEIIGEAVARIDEDFKAAHPDVPWRTIRGLRNIVAHVYWAVDYDILWHVVTTDVPVLHDQIERLLNTLP